MPAFAGTLSVIVPRTIAQPWKAQMFRSYLRLALFFTLCFTTLCHGQRQSAPQVERAELGDTKNVHACGDLFLAGQPMPDDVQLLKTRGVDRVITLRLDNEVDWDEEKAVTDAGMEFVSVPLRGPETFTDAVFGQIRELLGANEKKTVLHCGSANRVGGVWIAYRVLDQGVDLETAVQEAKQIGLRNPAYEQRAREYVAKMTAPVESRPPGLNDNFLNPNLDIDQWLGRFEVESREVYAARQDVLDTIGVRPGMEIADVGAGTGLYTRLFSEATGDQGWVHAVDISPRFLQHIRAQADEQGLENVTTVLCSPQRVGLPEESVDLVFICDTYHHFEFPSSTMRSIRRALRPNGMLVVIDFERIPGTSREWIVNHVRAGKGEFREEIEAVGFGFVEEVKIDGFRENYFLRFRKR